MKTVTLSEFQQHCLSILEDLSQTHQSIFISKSGKLMFYMIPVFPSEQVDWLGCMADTGAITGDILAPTHGELVFWEVLAQ